MEKQASDEILPSTQFWRSDETIEISCVELLNYICYFIITSISIEPILSTHIL